METFTNLEVRRADLLRKTAAVAKTRELRKWMALGVTLAIMLAASVAFGEEPSACREAYLESGLAGQQTSFAEFRAFSGDDTLCARSAS